MTGEGREVHLGATKRAQVPTGIVFGGFENRWIFTLHLEGAKGPRQKVLGWCVLWLCGAVRCIGRTCENLSQAPGEGKKKELGGGESIFGDRVYF